MNATGECPGEFALFVRVLFIDDVSMTSWMYEIFLFSLYKIIIQIPSEYIHCKSFGRSFLNCKRNPHPVYNPSSYICLVYVSNVFSFKNIYKMENLVTKSEKYH